LGPLRGGTVEFALCAVKGKTEKEITAAEIKRNKAAEIKRKMDPAHRHLIIKGLDPRLCCPSVSKVLFDIMFESLMSDIDNDPRHLG
jgi:hypothetical protein